LKHKKLLNIGSVILGTILLGMSIIYSVETYTATSDFCGSCHIMQKPYKSWKSSEHGKKDIPCVDCHYAPGKKGTLQAKFKGLGQLFTYLSSSDKEVRKPTFVDDRSCLASGCHLQEKFENKKITYAKNIKFTHLTHKEKTIEGQTLACASCHQHSKGTEHFEVPQKVCVLCHFKNTTFDEGRSECKLCHIALPTNPLQTRKKIKTRGTSTGLPMTHQSLEKAGVPCISCHFEIFLGDGALKKGVCLDCHDMENTLKNKTDKKRMHELHVTEQTASCFDCHQLIEHKKVPFIDPVRSRCASCHPDHHSFQKKLLLGDAREDIPQTPNLMLGSRTNCLGCHILEKVEKGEIVKHGTGKSCVACHTEKHDVMASNWKETTKEEVKYTKEFEEEAESVIKQAQNRVSHEKLLEAKEMFKKGQENLKIVEFGGGVHNKKYSIMLLDSAMNSFEDAIDLLNNDEQ